ncbi:MAG TPA: hypothetical protein VKG44_06000 [Candidatus Baltobacteraceae bacterium]|nr:hypothetical protein [Candidatus Baltobacteraceae bacterium]
MLEYTTDVLRRRILRIGLLAVLSLVLVDLPLLAFLTVERSKLLPAQKELTDAEKRERHEAIKLCQMRTIGEDTLQDTTEYFHELDQMRACMLNLGFHVHVVDEPGQRSFHVDFDNLTDK